MPPQGRRARLQADIQAASLQEIPHIHVTGKGDAQDEFTFTFTHPQLPGGELKLYAMPQNEGDYPVDHYFLVYTNDEVPSHIRNVLDTAMTSTRGMLIVGFLETLSRLLCETLDPPKADGRHINKHMIGADDDLDAVSDSDGSDSDIPFYYGDEDDYGDLAEHPSKETPVSPAALQRILQDLRAVKHAGFRVGKICGIAHVSEYSIVTISVRVSKLCLSEETRTAWNLQSSDYIVLLIKYHGDYIPFESALEMPTTQIPYEFRLRRCSSYRPTPAQAIAAFSAPSRKRGFGQSEEKPLEVENLRPSCSEFGVGGSIDLLLADFIIIMKLRMRCNVSWDNAKTIHTHLDAKARDQASMKIPDLDLETAATSTPDTKLPPILMDDHLSSKGPISLPLVAIQFSLRYLVKCTEYCMICHEKIGHNFEALKPYVCGNPLCLFQYMNIGLGPSIDHEIINQEYVVDLLISFCYASLTGPGGPRLREYPAGLNLQVPCVQRPTCSRRHGDIDIRGYGVLRDPREVNIFWSNSRVVVVDEMRAYHPGLTVGRWVVIRTHHPAQPENNQQPCTSNLDIFHYARIEEKMGATLYLHIASRYPVPLSVSSWWQIKNWKWDTGCSSGQLVFCNQSIDDLETPEDKAFSLVLLLGALPSVTEMRDYLMADQSRQLATWNRIPLESMKLLRWIIASNRSFIVQLDNPASLDTDSRDKEHNRPNRSREKILGVDGWIQFRFAQGSPEKEALFFGALDEVKKPQRTILAWHGSDLGNWHSILREGLNFKVVSNGRAYGEGCYFSRSWEYSLGYSNNLSSRTYSDHGCWPQSSLRINAAISLNELVNLPESFKHSQACYVVDVLHWIQCRYLFVRAQAPARVQENRDQVQPPKGREFQQDPQYAITGPGNKKLFIPEIAIPSVRRAQRRDASISSRFGDLENDDTDEDDIEDVEFLDIKNDSEIPSACTNNYMLPPPLEEQEFQTDFRPGSLDFTKLPQLAPPSYATGPAQRIIQRELQKLEKTQSETPLHDLGWYIDFGKIENMFQWIIELHSFDPSLPLAGDMKAAGITSIVLEIRFFDQFPVTPPFIRVVQPRFLAFAAGGGGHVTAGGFISKDMFWESGCMELLTTTGWSPANSMESVLLQVRLAMCGKDPKPARLDRSVCGTNQYSIGEAVSAAERAFRSHNWELPADFKSLHQ
ncbi:hypothetical protein NPX13_g9201 [Xylaria arbuscula]|uniref:UBC core domain-containing protein n=1 Tax=Xylaria arbuscula TaxID=114810 RepID=A0A9W8THQ2_9PEZI|nr:hypothetical protein NPX13_g9201 [Xylaria arbuscula]